MQVAIPLFPRFTALDAIGKRHDFRVTPTRAGRPLALAADA
mgnify:CR=1 FL=1